MNQTLLLCLGNHTSTLKWWIEGNLGVSKVKMLFFHVPCSGPSVITPVHIKVVFSPTHIQI